MADLRADGALPLSLVAVAGDAPVAHAALSPVAVNGATGGGRWLALGPVAVAPDRQRQGIGAALIDHAVAVAAAGGAAAVFVLGRSRYYRRLGFATAAGFGWRGTVPAAVEAFRVRCLDDAALPPPGTVRYHRAFDQL